MNPAERTSSFMHTVPIHCGRKAAYVKTDHYKCKNRKHTPMHTRAEQCELTFGSKVGNSISDILPCRPAVNRRGDACAEVFVHARHCAEVPALPGHTCNIRIVGESRTTQIRTVTGDRVSFRGIKDDRNTTKQEGNA